MREVQTEDMDALWEEYLKTRDGEAKNAILTHYLYLVTTIVKRVMPQYRSYCDRDDLIGDGVLGLIDAVEKYDPSMGTQFTTYASIRIRGAVLDYLRRQDWAPAALRKKLNDIQRATEELEGELGRQPGEGEIAQRADMTQREVSQALQSSQMFNVISFESLLYERECDDITSGGQEAAFTEIERRETSEAMKKLIEELPERERLVITLHYYEGLNMRSIADTLGVTESRVSQIHSKVLLKLRKLLE